MSRTNPLSVHSSGTHLYRVPSSRGFSMMELLVVSAIIMILLSLLFPTLRQARATARRAICASNQRQIGIGCEVYMNDHKQWILVFETPRNVMPISNKSITPSAPYKKHSYWESVWADSIRWCPDISSATNPSVPLPTTANNASLAFGYILPMLDKQAASWIGPPGADDQYDVNSTPKEYDYLRMGTTVKATKLDGTPWTYSSKTWVVYGSRPIATDFIWRRSQSASASTQNVIAHNTRFFSKSTTWLRPLGSNSLWEDGHVQWNRWNGVTLGEYRDVATGSIGKEGWIQEYPSLYYFYWAKRSR